MTARYVQIGAFTFDPVAGVLAHDGERTPLPGLSSRVLNVLIAHAPAAVDPQTLAREAWGLAHVEEDTLSQRIALLRKALGDDPRAPAYIRTERGRGYALIAKISSVSRLLPRHVAVAAAAAVLAVTAGVVAIQLRPETVEPAPAGEVEALLTRAGDQLALHQREETRRAIDLLSAASGRAPDDARVMTALSFALSTEATKFAGRRAEPAETLARRALADDESVAERWHALGYALDAQGRIDEALSAYLRAVRLDPGASRARSSAAYLMTVRGRLNDALRLDLEGLESDSRSLYAELQIARTLRLLGDERRARAFEARALLLNPDHPVVLAGLAEAGLSRGDPQAALDLIARAAPSERGRGELARLEGRARLALGDRDSAAELFEAAGEAAHFERAALAGAEVPAVSAGELWPAFYVGAAEALAGRDRVGALQSLERAVALGWRDDGLIRTSPFLAEMNANDAEAGLATEPALRARLDAVLGPSRG